MADGVVSPSIAARGNAGHGSGVFGATGSPFDGEPKAELTGAWSRDGIFSARRFAG